MSFRYAPPVALALLPFHLVSFATFLWTWTALAIAALGWVCRGWTLAALALYPVLLKVSVGNIHILLAAAIVLGFRLPESWTFVILTKVTTGVGILWFAFRAEWRLLVRALAAVAVVAAVTYPFVPGWWADWIRMLESNVGLSGSTSVAVPLALRFPVAWSSWRGVPARTVAGRCRSRPSSPSRRSGRRASRCSSRSSRWRRDRRRRRLGCRTSPRRP